MPGVTLGQSPQAGVVPAALRSGTRGAGNGAVRRQNLAAILRYVHVNGPNSRSVLAAATGLNRSTVGALVGDLAAWGLVRERAGTRGLPGRPSPVVVLRHDMYAVLAMEIFADSLAVATVGLGGQVLRLARIPHGRSRHGVEATLDDLARLARDVVDREPAGRTLVAVGVTVAGVVRAADGHVAMAPNMDWHRVPLAELLRGALRTLIPRGAPILVGNDADLAALAEHTRGAGAGVDDFIFLWGEQGLGAGIISGGRPLLGHSGFGGESGHLPIGLPDVECRCGSRGCWETVVGEEALLRRAGLGEREDARAALDELLEAAESGDVAAREAIGEVAHWLGTGLAGLVNLLNPSRIALGGYLQPYFRHIRSVIEDELDRRAMAAPRSDVEVVPALLGSDAPILGAAELAWGPLLTDPAAVPAAEGRDAAPARQRRMREEVAVADRV